jgi:hypothetical protein
LLGCEPITDPDAVFLCLFYATNTGGQVWAQ